MDPVRLISGWSLGLLEGSFPGAVTPAVTHPYKSTFFILYYFLVMVMACTNPYISLILFKIQFQIYPPHNSRFKGLISV